MDCAELPPTCCQVLAIRHGLTDYNAQRRLQGQLDVPLNDEGRSQCRDCGARLKQMLQEAQKTAVAVIYSSPLQRTKESAEIIRAAAGLTCEVRLDERIQEWNAGILQGHLLDELSTKFPKEWRAWNQSRDPSFVFSGGESFQHRFSRVKSFFLEVVALHAGQAIIVVTHGGVLDDLFRLIRNIPMNIKTNVPKVNAEIYIVKAHVKRQENTAESPAEPVSTEAAEANEVGSTAVAWEIIKWGKLSKSDGVTRRSGLQLSASNPGERSMSKRNLPPLFKQKTPPTKQQMRECGEGSHKGLLTASIDNADPDATILVHAQLTKAKFTAFSGAAVEREYDLKKILVPIETVDDRCFLLRYKGDFGTVFCARSLHSRNEWMNYLHESVLCKETGVKGKLPAEPGEEMEEEEAVLQTTPVEEPSGINIHLSDSPLGKPQVLVNGVTVQPANCFIFSVFPNPPSPSIHEFPNPAASVSPHDPDSLDSEGEEKTAEGKSIAAMHEAAAEQRLVSLNDPRVPETGYAKKAMKLSGEKQQAFHQTANLNVAASQQQADPLLTAWVTAKSAVGKM
ncbi:hypothetical protein Efla_004260 [Eimeria flavescens]